VYAGGNGGNGKTGGRGDPGVRPCGDKDTV
jgi:hypothetical protein